MMKNSVYSKNKAASNHTSQISKKHSISRKQQKLMHYAKAHANEYSRMREILKDVHDNFNRYHDISSTANVEEMLDFDADVDYYMKVEGYSRDFAYECASIDKEEMREANEKERSFYSCSYNFTAHESPKPKSNTIKLYIFWHEGPKSKDGLRQLYWSPYHDYDYSTHVYWHATEYSESDEE